MECVGCKAALWRLLRHLCGRHGDVLWAAVAAASRFVRALLSCMAFVCVLMNAVWECVYLRVFTGNMVDCHLWRAMWWQLVHGRLELGRMWLTQFSFALLLPW